MKNHVRIIAISITAFFVGAPLFADVGATGLDHVDNVRDARMSAVPIACAYVDDATAIFANPAGLGRMGENFQTCFGGGRLAQGISNGYLNIAVGTDNIGHYAISGTYTGYGSMSSTLAGPSGEFAGYGDDFTPYDYQFLLGAGIPVALLQDLSFLDEFYCGVVMKVVGHDSLGYRESGVLFDFGLAYGAEDGRDKLGASIHNLGAGEFLGAETPLLLRLAWASREELGGAGWLLWGLQGEGLLEGRMGLRVGIEYTPPIRVLSVRLGNTFDRDLGGLTGLSVGFGVEFSQGMLQGLGLDYAMQPMQGLGSNHIISFKTGLRMHAKSRTKSMRKSSGERDSSRQAVGSLAEEAADKPGQDCPYDQAKLAYKQGRHIRALDLLSAPDCLTAERDDIFILLGNASYKLGYREQALGYYRLALEINPDNAELQGFVEELEGR